MSMRADNPGVGMMLMQVEIFHGRPSALPLVAGSVLSQPTAAAGRMFGLGISASGDVDGDGFGNLVSGSHTPAVDPTGTMGAVVMFGGPGGLQASRHVVIPKPDPDAVDLLFAYDTISAVDVDGDGLMEVVFGAPFRARGTTSNVGAVEIYEVNGARSVSYSGIIQSPNATANALFGFRIASTGDANGDGKSDFAGYYELGEPFVAVFLGSPAVPVTPTSTLSDTSCVGVLGSHFGTLD